MSENTTIPEAITAETDTLAERYPAGVEVREEPSDLPGFRYFQLFGTAEECPEGGIGICEDATDDHDHEPVRIGGRLVLTLEGGRAVELDEQETADVMWALANATRRNRKAKTHGNNPEREARFARQTAVMQKIADAPSA